MLCFLQGIASPSSIQRKRGSTTPDALTDTECYRAADCALNPLEDFWLLQGNASVQQWNLRHSVQPSVSHPVRCHIYGRVKLCQSQRRCQQLVGRHALCPVEPLLVLSSCSQVRLHRSSHSAVIRSCSGFLLAHDMMLGTHSVCIMLV